MKTFGLMGWSGSGKTTLMVKLLGAFIGRGFKVSTMKHTHHKFDMDTPGKDSHEHRLGGATEVMVTSSTRWALLHELRDEAEPDIDDLIARMATVDLLLIEGFKSHPHKKIEVFRPSIDKPLLSTDDPSVVAVACDAPLPEARVPVFDLEDIAGMADFIIHFCGLENIVAEHGDGAA